jgi:ribosome biogenesis protein UTP30
LDGEGGGSTLVYLEVGFNKIDEKSSLKPVRLSIPNPFRDASSEDLTVCLFTKDPQRQYKDLIKPMGISSITKITGISKLRTKFKPFEAKRALCASFDMFAADSSLLPLLPKLLGKKFFEKKKQPIPVNLTGDPEEIARELKRGIESTYFFRTGGSNTSICVGRTTQGAGEIAANIEAVIRQLSKKLPAGLSVVRCIHVKTPGSVALPIYIREKEPNHNHGK